MNLQELVEKVLTWSYDRNIINGSDFYRQYMKAQSEMGELAEAYLKEDKGEIKDAIGDVLVCLINLSEQCDINLVFKPTKYTSFTEVPGLLLQAQVHMGNLADALLKGEKEDTERYINNAIYVLDLVASKLQLTLQECLESAYDSIKDRKGVMFQGVFVKESDENYERIIKNLARDSFIP